METAKESDKSIWSLVRKIGLISFILLMGWVFGICLLLMPGPGTYLDPDLATSLLSPTPFILPFVVGFWMIGTFLRPIESIEVNVVK